MLRSVTVWFRIFAICANLPQESLLWSRLLQDLRFSNAPDFYRWLFVRFRIKSCLCNKRTSSLSLVKKWFAKSRDGAAAQRRGNGDLSCGQVRFEVCDYLFLNLEGVISPISYDLTTNASSWRNTPASGVNDGLMHTKYHSPQNIPRNECCCCEQPIGKQQKTITAIWGRSFNRRMSLAANQIHREFLMTANQMHDP